MVSKSIVKKIVKDDIKRLMSIVKVEGDLLSLTETYFYLFYTSLFNQDDRLGIWGEKNVFVKKELEDGASVKSFFLNHHMRILAMSNRDLPLIINTCLANSQTLKKENKMMKELLTKMKWSGEVNSMIMTQSPDFIYFYSKLNAFLKLSIGIESRRNLKDSELLK